MDGLRALAVLLVLFGHVSIRNRLGPGGTVSDLMAETGLLGVSLFFVISGFIITRLLIREIEQTGRIYLVRFYARRIVRLWPALWVMVMVTVLLTAVGALQAHVKDVAAALLFVTDYTPGPNSEALFHTWSLGVEEQFYLIWPPVLLALGLMRGRRVVAGAILAAPIIRVACYFLIPAWRDHSFWQFHNRYDLPAVGCLLALCWDDERLQRLVRVWAYPLVAGGVAALAATEVVAADLTTDGFQLLVGYTVQAAALAAIIAGGIAAADRGLGRFLNSRLLVHIGLTSYSLYLWQQMFLVTPFGPFTFVPLAVLATFLCAELSWRLLERPFESVRRRLHPDGAARW